MMRSTDPGIVPAGSGRSENTVIGVRGIIGAPQ